MTETSNALKDESIGKLLLKFSIPAIIGMMVNALYNVVDRIYIGWVGPLAMTGIGLNMPIMTMMMGFGMLVGIGAGANISIRLGQGKRDEAEKVLGNAVTLLVIIMSAITILGLIYKIPLLYLFGASDATIRYADQYITIILAGSIFQGVGFGINNIIRSEGSPKIAMYTMIIGAIINIILDPILIFTFDMGIAGAAYATVFSQLVSTIWVLYHFSSSKSILKLKLQNLKLQKSLVLSILAIGISPFSMQVAASIVSVLSNTALKATGGDLAIGAMTIINAVAIFFLMPIFGLNQGTQPIIGYNYGAKLYGRVKETLKLAILVATAICMVAFVLTQFFTVYLIRIFNDDPELMRYAVTGMRIFLCMLPFIGFQIISANYFQATGKASKAIFLSMLRQVIVLIPMLLILPPLFGIKGVWITGPLSDFTASVLTAIFLFREIKHLDTMEAV